MRDLLAVGVEQASSQWEKSLAPIRESVLTRENDVEDLVTTGALLLAAGRADRAADVLAVALQCRPSDPQIRLLLGYAFRRCGDPTRAADSLAIGRELDPDHALLGGELALALIEAGRLPQAARLCDELVQQFPTRRQFQSLHQWIRESVRNPEQADEGALNARRNDVPDPNRAFRLGG